MIPFPDNPVTLENLGFLGAGFLLGILVAFILARLGMTLISGRLKDLSNQALYENSVKFMDLARDHFTGFVREARQDFRAKGDEIRQAVDPVHKVLDRYEQRLGMMEKERDQAYGAISQHLADMARTQHLLHTETGNLVKALRVPHVRGRWGEITLKKAAELSGMAEHCDFSEQMTAGSGKGSLRPDMVVTLPGNRRIIVDAKVPLIAYLDALETEDEDEREVRMTAHARQVLAHISQLGSKKYTERFSPSPEFVVLFIPGENFFSAALAQKPDLIEKGIAQGVILATPTTLIALLKAVAYSWQQQKGYENAEAIRDLGGELYRRLSTMAEHMNRLGRDIERTAATFNRTAGAMETRVMASARKLDDLAVTGKPLPEVKPVPVEKGTTREMKQVDAPEVEAPQAK
ncbi:MAG: DNA recombination protein RmuC [Desulfobacterales bacterium]|nr:DNA recombination protein RmuC [Desulfobacterales bacterium]